MLAKDGRVASFRGSTEQFSVLTALLGPSARPSLAPLAPLRAALISGLVLSRNQEQPIADSHIESLASAIRGIEDRTGHPLRRALLSLGGVPVPSQLADALTFSEDSPEQFRESWERAWSPWLRGLTSFLTAGESDPPAQTHSEDEESDPSEPEVRIITAPLEGGDPGFSDEPDDEHAPWVSFAQPKPGPSNLVPSLRSAEIQYAHQRILQGNSHLLTEHIEALTRAEFGLVVRQLLKISADTAEPLPRRQRAIVTLLIGATGRAAKRICEADIGLTSTGRVSRLTINLARGGIDEPVLDVGTRRPEGRAKKHFEAADDQLFLPLNGDVVKSLRSILQQQPVARLQDWFGAASAEAEVDGFLKSLEEIPEPSRNQARLRRWLSTAVQEAGLDLPSTMLIVGDTLGRSTSPLHYYAPKLKNLYEIHRRALFDVLPVPEISPPGSQRIGKANVLKLIDARAGISQVCNSLNLSTTAEEAADPVRATQIHNRLAMYLMLYICLITGHRPHKALFRLKRYSFDIHYGFALLDDKRIDAAHRNRLTVLTANLCTQLEAFFQHLLALKVQHWITPRVAAKIEAILDGNAPLLCFFDVENELVRGTPDHWKQMWPEAWENVQHNWYRAYLATHLRELGVDGTSAAAHLGHLEAAGYPWNSDSVLIPIDLTTSVQPALEHIEQSLGFKIRRGFAALCSTPPSIPPLQDWSRLLAEHQKQERAHAQEEARVRKASFRRVKNRARDWIETTLTAVAPDLLNVIWNKRRQSVNGQPLPPPSVLRVTPETRELILGKISDDLESQPILRIAVHNALCRSMRHAMRSGKLSGDDIGLIIAASATELAPFLAHNQGLATIQLGLLRDRLQEKQSPSRPIPSEIRRTLALVLFGGFTDPELILQLACASTQSITATHRHDGMLVTIDGLRGGPVGLRDHCALAFLEAPNAHPLTLPNAAALSRALYQYLPSDLAGSSHELLERLCSTVAAARRVEASGLARVMHSHHGCIDASSGMQSAFLHGEPAPDPMLPAADLVDSWNDEEGDTTEVFRDRAVAGDLRAYKRLTSLTNDPQTYLDGPARPDNPVKKKVHSVSPAALVRALDKFIACEPQQLTVVRALAMFAKDMLAPTTPGGRALKPSTVRTYVSSFGRQLVEQFSGKDLDDLDEDEFIEVYETIANRDIESISRCRAQLRDFHDFLVRDFGIDPIADGALDLPYTSQTDNRAAHLVTEGDYERALAWFMSQLAVTEKSSDVRLSAWRRRCHAAACVLILLYRSGSRISEVAWLKHQDLLSIEGLTLLFIKPSRFRRLKTAAARRLLNLSTKLSSSERDILTGWISNEVLRHGDSFSRSTLLFPSLESPNAGIGSGPFRVLVKLAFAQTGRNIWPHQLRHSDISQGLRLVSATAVDREQYSSARVLRFAKQFKARVGHAWLTTSARNYFHLSWLFRFTPLEVSARADSRGSLAALTGRSIATVDKIRQRARTEAYAPTRTPWASALYRTSLPVRRSPTLHRHGKGAMSDAEAISKPFTAQHLSQLLWETTDARPLPVLAVSFGLSTSMIELIDKECSALYDRCGYRLIALRGQKGHVAKDDRPRLFSGSKLDCLLQPMPPPQARTLGDLFQRCYTNTHARTNVMRGLEQDIRNLRTHLILASVPVGVIHIALESEGKAALRVDDSQGFRFLAGSLATLAVWSALTEVPSLSKLSRV